MRYNRRIESRIRWLLVTFTLLISLFFVLMLLSYSWVVEDNIFNRMVASEAQYIVNMFEQEQKIVSPRAPFMHLYRNWSELPETVQLLRQQSPDRIEFPTSEGGTLHLTTLSLGQNQWILAADVKEFEVSRDYLPRIVKWIVLSLLGIGLLTFWISHYLTKQIVRPIKAIADSVASHSKESHLYFNYQFSDDEIGYLASIVEVSFNRLRQALERESQFTRDISHELRTPTAVLKILSEKVQSHQFLSEDSQARLVQAVQQIEHTLTVLLALAREESIQTEALNLSEELEWCIVNHPVLSSHEHADLTLRLDNSAAVVANRNLLHIMLNNLLDNAINHGTDISVDIVIDQQSIVFSNPVNQPIQDSVFNDKTKSDTSSGLGLGLNLVKRIVENMGWQVTAYAKANRFVVAVSFAK